MSVDRFRSRLWLGALLLCAAGLVQATPEIQTWETDNGARVLFVAAPGLPMVDLRLAFDAGSARDGARPGLASLTAAMLAQGAGEWDADTIASRLEGVGAEFGSGVDRDIFSVSLRSLTREPALDTALDTLTALLAAPRFPAVDLERVRENRLVALRQQQESPRTQASRAFYRAIYGDHPYAEDPSGTAEGVGAITRDDLVAFHQRYLVGANAVVAIVGALDRAGAERLAERVVGVLPRGEAAPALPEVAALEQAAQRHIAFPSSQTAVLVGQPGMRRGDPDYFALYVGNHILGGSGLVSQLMHEVREQRGLSYSVYSYFLPLDRPGPFLMGLQTRNDQAEQAIAVMRETLERFIAEGPTEDELDAARRNITGGFPLRIDSNGDIVQYLAMIGFYDLPLDHLARFAERVEAVDAAQIRDAFARRVDPERMVLVQVGGGAGQTARADAPE
ncbi:MULTISPECIES: pitrilysin family protein [Marichromatium]|uniref:Zinc protease n=1 Tax=Marichromatium gracile TaxID=1048 RepID=A0A4R4AMD3_MARGR|nr:MULTISPECIES: pitrilysin family protein [Marichromatium]MBK1708747.1 peptidase M16 [Marichromatium gracile]RNE89066.1 insulinase family protein [Marichromatium sp. AB31]TCW40069.1 zinc protease [Marichromatium gracile]